MKLINITKTCFFVNFSPYIINLADEFSADVF